MAPKKKTRKSSSTPAKRSVKKVQTKARSSSAAKSASQPKRTKAQNSSPAVKKTASKGATKPVSRTKAKSSTKASARPVRRPAASSAAAAVVETKPLKAARRRKNAAGLGVRDLERYRTLLLAKRRELLGDVMSMEDEALRSSGTSNLSNLPIHMADMGTDNYEQEFTLGLVEKDRTMLREIHAALVKIQDGTYGVCEGTGKPISKARLDAQPWTRYSIEYARKMEQRNLRR